MKGKSVVVYTVLRLLFFLVPLGLMLLLPIFRELWWLAAFFAMIIGLSLSMIFLRQPLTEVSSSLAERRDRKRQTIVTDEDIEDASTEVEPDQRPDRAD